MYQPHPTPYASCACDNYAYYPETQREIGGASRESCPTDTGLQAYGAVGCGSNNGGGFPYERDAGAFGAGGSAPPGATPQLLLRSTLNPPNPGHFHRSSFTANSNNFSVHQTEHSPTHRSRCKLNSDMEGYELTDDMLAQDLAAQEEAARQYQPQLEVRVSLA
jgi:hypothetical protein